MELLPSLLSTLKSMDPGTVDQEYSVVRSKSLLLKKEHDFTTEVGSLKENIKKNRYKDILPYDQTRVVLSLQTSGSHSDYINGSFIQGASGDCKYIASQGPLSSTVTDFWRMIWQHSVKVIVMACRETEMGKRKCECYWAAPHQSAAFGPFTVTTQVEKRYNEDIVVRTLTVSYQQDAHSVIQFQYLSWPDHDVPYETAGVLDLLEQARRSRGADTSPVLIHCSAGCGRTGVICALDYIYDLLVTKQITKDFSILNIVLELRRQRPSAVQTKDQYRFIFTAVISMFERFLQTSDVQLYCNLPEVKIREKKTSTAASSSINRLSKRATMNDTYAVVNKPKQPHQTTSERAYSSVVTPNPGSRSLPPSHHYDNDFNGASAAPIYSTVKPRVKPLTLPHSTSNIYDIATPTSQSREGSDYDLVSAEHLSAADDEYEDISSPVSNVSSFFSPGGIGFNCRIQKPKGPRDPPAEWGRLER
ncbi:tyrosine-protein phosphatase non-receptor type 18 isoform X2 [Girardinichthys multiradiatus]|uniref:tyrosine-protein phosphatase non-receptor type 18 isoform X2 n=1 Tax=Girardinichthys multiradiatus TaxID=208333 RepID=UPI001FAC53D8|nr:tyrosine-protein phosphatase non-receptor type 18 isoform X2 [Girardinichthys multiradiatus]